jgi:putative peptidoglycan lipid II flippase
MSNAQFIRSNIIITFLSLVGVGVNFITQMVLAYYFGARIERDAYFAAMTVPAYLVTLFVGSLTVIFLPFYMDFKKDKTEDEVRKFVSSTIGVVFCALIVVCALGFVFSNLIIESLAPGFSQEQSLFASSLFRILIATVLFQCTTSLLSIFHHVDQHFFLPALSPVLIPIASLISITLFHSAGISSLAVGAVIGSCLGMVLLLPGAKKLVNIKYLFRFTNADTGRLLVKTLPLLVTGAVFRLTTIIERMLASTLAEGSISYLGYSSQLYMLLATIASGSIVTTFYPIMSAAWGHKDHLEFKSLLARGIRLILLITLPIAAIFLPLRDPVIEFLFQRGAFDATATHAVASCLSIMMGAFLFGSLGNILVKVFYIAGNIYTISAICIIEVACYAIAGMLLTRQFGYLGLAASLSLSSGFTIVAASFFLKKWRILELRKLLPDVLKLILSAILAGLITYIVFQQFNAGMLMIAIPVSCVVGLVGYLIAILTLKITDAAIINRTFRSYF